MANAILYVDSAASGTGTGASWANAFTTMAAAITASTTTGTDFYVSSAHTETASAFAFAYKGVSNTPDRVFSCTKTNSPPQISNLASGATFTASGTTGTTNINGFAYIFGCLFSQAGSSGSLVFNVATSTSISSNVTLDTCKVTLTVNNTLISNCNVTTNLQGTATWINTPIVSAGSACGIQANIGNFRWYNTPSAMQGTAMGALFKGGSQTRFGQYLLEGIDLTGMSTSCSGVGSLACAPNIQFLNCKLPVSGFVPALNPTIPGTSYDFVNSASGLVNGSVFSQSRYQYAGVMSSDNTVYNSASDGVNSMSWKFVTNANATTNTPLESFDIVQWVASGTYASGAVVATSTVSGLTGSDIWATMQYMGTASSPNMSRVVSSTPQLPQGTSPTNLTSGATWAVSGQGTNYSIAIPSFTVTAAGYVRATVFVGKPSLTIWVDPHITVA